MAHLVNERNTGKYSLGSEAKNRKSKIEKQITNEEKTIVKAILSKVYDSLQYDKDLSDCGHLSPNALFTDGGRFIISMDRVTFEKLDNIINKL